MIRELTNFKSCSIIEQGTEADILAISSLKYTNIPIGSGSFGDVHEIVEINNGSTSQYVVKIIKESANADHAFEVIYLLHLKIKKDRRNQQSTIYQSYPGLMGLPFAVFRAFDAIENKEVIGMVMFDLDYLGYMDYGNDTRNSSINDDSNLSLRISLSYQLAKSIDFLHRNMFIHSDLSENALWVNKEKQLIALIDFDSGFHYDSQNKATTLGKITHWGSSLWRKVIQLGNSSNLLSKEDRIDEENWVIANALFELIFTVPPFFFLTDTEDNTHKKYLKNNKWPNIDKKDDSINEKNIPAYEEVIHKLNELVKLDCANLIELFVKSFNYGYFDSKKRISVNEWFIQLLEVSKLFELTPSIKQFNSDRKTIDRRNESVQFIWDCKNFEYLTLNDMVLPLFSNTCFFKIEDSSEVELIAISSIGTSKKVIKIEAKRIQPIFKSIMASEIIRSTEDPITISWDTDFAYKVMVEGIQAIHSNKGQIVVHPIQKTTYKIIAFGNFDQVEEKTITVDVILPIIKVFNWKIDIKKGIDNVNLFWETDFTHSCQINPLIDEVSASGQTDVRIKSKTEFELIANGLYGQSKRRIEANPFCAPIIETIFTKAPPIEISTHVDVSPLRIDIRIPEIFMEDSHLNIQFNYQSNISPNFSNLPVFTLENNQLLPELKTYWFSRSYQEIKQIVVKCFSKI